MLCFSAHFLQQIFTFATYAWLEFYVKHLTVVKTYTFLTYTPENKYINPNKHSKLQKKSCLKYGFTRYTDFGISTPHLNIEHGYFLHISDFLILSMYLLSRNPIKKLEAFFFFYRNSMC